MWPVVAPNIHKLSESGLFWYLSSRRSILKYREEMLEISLKHFLNLLFCVAFLIWRMFLLESIWKLNMFLGKRKLLQTHPFWRQNHVGFAVLRICYQVTAHQNISIDSWKIPPIPPKKDRWTPPRKGHFKTRHELLQIKGLGPKSAWETPMVGPSGWLDGSVGGRGEVSALLFARPGHEMEGRRWFTIPRCH